MFTFKTKEEYLVYRSEWKEKYAKVSKSIRMYRLYLKDNQRLWNQAVKLTSDGLPYVDYYHAYRTVESLPKTENHKKLEAFVDSDEFISNGQEVAKQMLEELKEAKIEAQRQYQAAKKQLVEQKS